MNIIDTLVSLRSGRNNINATVSYLHECNSLINKCLPLGNSCDSSLIYCAYTVHLTHSKMVHLVIALFFQLKVFFLQMFCASHAETLTLGLPGDFQRLINLCDSTCGKAVILRIHHTDHRVRPMTDLCIVQ